MLQPETDAEWCLNAVQTAVTFERLIALAAAFILDGSAEYKSDPVFSAVRSAFAERVRILQIPEGDIRLDAIRDPVRAIDSYMTGNAISELAGDLLQPLHNLRPDSNPLPPRAKVTAVKAGSGASISAQQVLFSS